MLHVVAVISNSAGFERRYQLAREFMARMNKTEDVTLYVVEMAYGSQLHRITSASNPRHLQLRTLHPLWHKENMINVGIQKLLPPDWRYMAWIDADIEFDNPRWAADTMEVLDSGTEVVQPFSHIVDMNINQDAMQICPSFCYQYVHGRKHLRRDHMGASNFPHTGYAWAISRAAFEKMGCEIYEYSILGSGDYNIAMALVGEQSLQEGMDPAYKDSLERFIRRVRGMTLGYTSGVIRHHFHGRKADRHYGTRWKFLAQHAFDPYKHLLKDNMGILIPSPSFPPLLLEQIKTYFVKRKEDPFSAKEASAVLPETNIFRQFMRIRLVK